MTSEEKKKLYASLSAPFPEEAIERTDGRTTGRGYSTTGIKYQYIANRLNEVLGIGGFRAHRTVTIREISTQNGRKMFEAICDLTLELGEWVNGEFVPFAEALADGGHVSVSEADARKGSYTNAFKKAAAFLGVGKQAYEGSIDDDNTPGADIEPTSSRPVPQPQQRASTASAGARQRLTSKQLNAIFTIARKLGFEQQAFRSQIKLQYGAQPEFLTSAQASQLIDSLNAGAIQANGHAAPHGEG